MSRPRYLAAAVLDRASAFRPVARSREVVRGVRAPDPSELAPDGLPYPPARLRVRVIDGGDPAGFFHGGRTTATAVRDALARAGVAPSELHDVLDFGCGCGRVARHFRTEPWNLHGCDYNASAIEWCDRHLPFMKASVNGLEPPLPYPDDSLDLVYAVSVLTHLTDTLGRAWIDEWRRMIRSGGVLLFTTIGDTRRHHLNARQLAVYDGGEPVVTKERLEGMNACVAHHPPGYVTGSLLDGLEVLAAVPGGTTPDFPQDTYVARVR
jgi:SAM-dependent methyltransferase